MIFTLLALSLQVDFDLKFPWENNEEESFSSKSPRKLHNPYQKKYYKPVFPHLQSRCLHSQTMTYYPKPRFHSANEEEEGIHVDFDLKFPWEKNEKESFSSITSNKQPSIPKPYPSILFPRPRFHSANEEEEGIHVDFDLKFPWEKNEKESNTLASSHNKNSDPITRGFFPKPKKSPRIGKRSPYNKM